MSYTIPLNDQVERDSTVYQFEQTIANFYGAPYAIAVDSCTHAIELCMRYEGFNRAVVPTHTYLSVPLIMKKIGGIEWKWDDSTWSDFYYIKETNIIDAAVYWKENSYLSGTLMCLSFQFQKHLSLGRGGMILTDNLEASKQLKKMSYDGREPDIPWREQNIETMGYHYYMTPETANLGIHKLPAAIETEPRKWSVEDWPDLTTMSIFKQEK